MSFTVIIYKPICLHNPAQICYETVKELFEYLDVTQQD